MNLRRSISLAVVFALVGAGALLHPFIDAGARSNRANRLQGTWRVDMSPKNCQTGELILPFSFLVSFAQDGSLTEVINAAPFLPGQRSTGLGVWSHTSGNSYKTVSDAFILFDSPGFTKGRQRLKWDITVDGDRATIASSGQFLDISGNVLANTCADGRATRFEDLQDAD